MTLYLGTDPSHYKAQGKLIHYPILKLIPREVPSYIFEEISKYTHCIFTSKNTVSLLKEAFAKKGLSMEILQTKQIIALGQVTAARLEEEGLRVVAIAQEETQEGVIDLLKQMVLDQAYIFLPHSALARDELENFLKESKVSYQVCDLYDTVAQTLGPLPNLNEVDEIVFTSPSCVRAFFDIFISVPNGKKLSCIGPITKKELTRIIDQKRREGILSLRACPRITSQS